MHKQFHSLRKNHLSLQEQVQKVQNEMGNKSRMLFEDTTIDIEQQLDLVSEISDLSNDLIHLMEQIEELFNDALLKAVVTEGIAND